MRHVAGKTVENAQWKETVMPALKTETYESKKKWLMEQAYDCFAQQGLHGTGIRTVAKYAGVNSTVFYTYFKNLDDLIIQSTEYCMQKVEESFMEIAPKSADDIDRFIDEVPEWANEKYCQKFRLMYQVYTHPKYRDAGLKFFAAMNKRYAAYAQSIARDTGISADVIRPLVYVFVRACVFYFLFEEKDILDEQMNFLKQTVHLYVTLGNVMAKQTTDHK